ncbi:MarR family transcriptional regulator [Burkholderia diffusa]|uniref:MarR family transcriptional regulator n=1 Tax=Burkholderia diffusa TaxID=488732 RepID=A0AAW3PAN8_9BURK|nr:MarR family transcriptional regulator [Burkholderia diffusa]KWF32688.1 MarR family transcriptional regulator [Burkholderia diffusa]KWF38613.1 MarR family transcriptional regulator [Burkholderia diffusa]KWF46658.1 MarR family transcriptional regulator [Burkholderia diffusa]KWF50768.1 MarR family transcriptional regulator [Burkholderia diffusa]
MKTPTDSRSIKVDHDLEKAIPYLVTRAGARMGNAFSNALKPYGLSLSEWRVCASLGYKPGQTLSELVMHASVDMSALSRIVDRLVQQGLVRRAKSERDGRAVSLSLTPKGAALAREIAPLAKHYEKVALTRFTEQEVEVLRRLLIQLYDNAEPLE